MNICKFHECHSILTALLMRPVESINCSQPTPESLLTALRETAFTKTEVRPVISLKTPTKITLGFVMYAILDVVSKFMYDTPTVTSHFIGCHSQIIPVTCHVSVHY